MSDPIYRPKNAIGMACLGSLNELIMSLNERVDPVGEGIFPTVRGGLDRTCRSPRVAVAMAGCLHPCRVSAWILAVGFCLPTAFAGSAWFARVWRSDDGLPNEHVTALAQSQDGYLWVATSTGLARFDGSRFTPVSFRALDGDRSVPPGVGGVVALSDGGVLISRLRGPVVRLSANGSTLSLVPTGVREGVMPLNSTEDKQGGLWVGYADGSVVRVGPDGTRRFEERDGVPKAATIYSLACDVSGTVWLAKGDAVLVFRDGKFEPLGALNGIFRPHDKLRLRAARHGGVWIVNRQGRLYRATATGELTYYGVALPDSSNATALMVMEDHTGAVWIGTDIAGLFRFADGQFEHVGTSLPSITSLLETADGAIWAGTAGAGLDRLSPRRVLLDDLGSNGAQIGAASVAEDSAGNIWLVASDGRVLTRRDGAWTDRLASGVGVATCIAPDRRGGVWIATRDGFVYTWREGRLTVVATSSTTGGFISCLLPATNGDLWIGRYFGEHRVMRLRDGQWTRYAIPDEGDRVLAMVEDHEGRIWVGTRIGSLLHPEGDRLVNATGATALKRWPIESLYVDRDGTLWVGYEGLGVGRWKDGQMALLNSDRGLPDNYVSQIVSDGRGWAWFGADHGVFKIRWSELNDALDGRLAQVRPILFGPSEGLRDLQASNGVFPGGMLSRNGQVWLPLRSGVAIADPTALDEQPSKPAVYLISVAAGDRTVARYDSGFSSEPVENLHTWRGPLQLRPDETRVTIEFAAVDFMAPENVRFRYRMDGVDTRWVEIGLERRATYSHIGAGRYAFHVQASVGDGPWNESVAPFAIEVIPYFWQTTWFGLGVLLTFTIGGILVTRAIAHRRYQARVRALEQQTALEKERARIGRDLHDDLGGALTQVALMLDMAGREATNGANERLTQCSQMVRQVAKSVDEIIWAINPRNDTVPYLVDYLSQFVVEFLHSANIRCRVDLPDRIPDRRVTPEARHHLFLAVKETLANIVRHARATQVELHIAADDTSLSVRIEDNGCGFDAAPDNSTSDGLRNIRDRMAEIGGRFEITSERGAGTRVSLVCLWEQEA